MGLSGSMYVDGCEEIVLENCEFLENIGSLGGVLGVRGECSAVLVDSKFRYKLALRHATREILGGQHSAWQHAD